MLLLSALKKAFAEFLQHIQCIGGCINTCMSLSGSELINTGIGSQKEFDLRTPGILKVERGLKRKQEKGESWCRVYKQ